MASTSTLSLQLCPNILQVNHVQEKKFHANSLRSSVSFRGQKLPIPKPLRINNNNGRRLKPGVSQFDSKFTIKAVSSWCSSSSSFNPSGKKFWKSYNVPHQEVQVRAPVYKKIASFFVSVGTFMRIMIWKLAKTILPIPMKAIEEKRCSVGGINRCLALGGIDMDIEQTLNEFAEALKSSRVADLSGCDIGDKGLLELAESLDHNQTLEKVNFSDNGITGEGLKAFDGVLQTNTVLTTLNLSGNPIGDEGAKRLRDILVDNTSIQKLQLNNTGLGDEGAKAIAELLVKDSSLRVLELDNNFIEHSGITALADSLPWNISLQVMSLNGNSGRALGAEALGKGLARNQSLRELHLSGNSIGDHGVRALLSGLLLHKGKFAALDIGNNMISSLGAHYVAEHLRSTKTLCWISLFMNNLQDAGAAKVADALKVNRTIKSIDLGANNINDKGIEHISEAIQKNTEIQTVTL